MTDITFWPRLLAPAKIDVTHAPNTRSGGRTLGGVVRAVSTDLGFWRVSFSDVPLYGPAHRRVWNALRTKANGRSGVLCIPVWSFDTAPFASGAFEASPLTTHSDGSTFSDGAKYVQGTITVEMNAAASIGDTSVTLKAVNAGNLAGIRFSYQHALYETGPATSISGSVWKVPVFPAVREAIPANASLECDHPTLLVHLADDSGMDLPLDANRYGTASVDFVEACDYWTDLALAA